MVGKMSRKRHEEQDLSGTERRLLQEMIETYQGLKMMSRIIKWIALFVFMCVMDFFRFREILENIFSHLKKWITKS
ncbi:hypothetical protein [Bartonella tribocorum]|uniref:Uncharacterized protein n=1 Tax=Bartonella tribocorum TaxID=85701 RepID=A0A2N9Y864_9HYPH|nr:hypothetical protein [Bartonella tribocorum]PIT67897.1 hypothetical protein CER18_09170 [Bartonella tribocorum]